ncbi:DUF3185 family protein [Aliidiomarina haloalkalitolerans]|uniref:DUF3185 domain-containing protein n=1 Tax=Aliidiomarina haloalkalitolerans TaxID=859059 RepID=A0A432VYV9_9GAMM|nr:DUF3185 family protein [Aliidiomarina haloalkalitolerans]RUO21869.1 hypothetical protein CWE06_03220 [Aliidiomarina haloalkalitolerans]
MNKFVSLAILVAGLIVLYFGWQEKESAASQVSEAFTGQPTDNAMWFLIVGAVLTIVGIGGFISGMKK